MAGTTVIGVAGTTVIAGLAFVLILAAVAKLRRPGAAPQIQRAQALGELTLAGVAIAVPTRLSGALLAAVFAGFAVWHARRRSTLEPAGCDCFGDEQGSVWRTSADDLSAASIAHGDVGSSPAGGRPVLLTGTSACAAAGAAAFAGSRSPVGLIGSRPVLAVAVMLIALLGAELWRMAFMETLPGPAGAGDRLVTASALLLERHLTRRTLLLRVAVVGSALCVAPLRYLLYPGSALAAISPGDCAGGACTDGFTAFCCQINHGLNTCPADTFPGGWWMCTDYAGRYLCAEQGVRYYVDCNAMPGREFPGGCRCANDSCDEQRVACNVFRYGQCNTQIEGVTAVVCRMVVCESPASISELNCSSSVAVDDSVCAQDTPCLEPRAVVPVGAGGV